MAFTYANYLLFYKERYNYFLSFKMRYVWQMSEYTVYLFILSHVGSFARLRDSDVEINFESNPIQGMHTKPSITSNTLLSSCQHNMYMEHNKNDLQDFQAMKKIHFSQHKYLCVRVHLRIQHSSIFRNIAQHYYGTPSLHNVKLQIIQTICVRQCF